MPLVNRCGADAARYICLHGPRSGRHAAACFPSEPLQPFHVPFLLVPPSPGGQTRCLPLQELSHHVFASADPGSRSLEVERCPPSRRCVPHPCRYLSRHWLLVTPRPCRGGLPRLPLPATRPTPAAPDEEVVVSGAAKAVPSRAKVTPALTGRICVPPSSPAA